MGVGGAEVGPGISGPNTGGGGGSGTVTSVSVTSANGFAGTVANATTTPAITITATPTGILKANGTAISAATAGTDYSAGTSGLATGILKSTTGTGGLTIALPGTDYIAGPLTGDVTTVGNAATLVGTANVESIIRANTLDQMAAPAGNLSINNKRLLTVANAIVATDAPNIGQLADNDYAYVVSGCVWTADSSGATLNGSMTAGTVRIAGILLTVAAITAHAFTASKDTYVDFTDNGDGTAAVTYTAVNNNAMSPVLAGGATAYTTVRNAIIVSTGSALTTGNNTINQGDPQVTSPSTAAATTTVAAGSNGNNITTATLSVAANTLAPAGLAKVATTGGGTNFEAIISYASGGGTTTLSGITVLSGAGTVATGGAVTQVATWATTDGLGNLIFPTSARPSLICSAVKGSGAITTTVTNGNPVANLTRRFIIPPGPSRRVKAWGHIAYLSSSAAIGSQYATVINAGGISATAVAQVAVVSDGTTMHPTVVALLAPGTYTVTLQCNEGAAGTLTVDSTFTSSLLGVELG